MRYIIISKTTASKIRGEHGKYSAIDPLPLGDGKYIIPGSVLDDIDLKEIHGLIPESNPRKTIDDIKKMYPEFQREEI